MRHYDEDYEDDDHWEDYEVDDYYDYYDYYDCALHQESIVQDRIYSGELLISEIRQQDLRPALLDFSLIHKLTELMYVLATAYMLIADIDCGDNIEEPLNKLTDFVDKNGGSFRVYKTKNGMRYLQTDLLYQGANKSAIATLEALGSDPQYVDLCSTGKSFMARLTPKIQPELALKYFEDRQLGLAPDRAVCHFLKTVGSYEISLSLTQSIELHDYLTQSDRTDLKLS